MQGVVITHLYKKRTYNDRSIIVVTCDCAVLNSDKICICV